MKKRMNKGQGVIEYAGAMVIAAVLVGAALLTGPEGVENLFSNIIAAAGDMITSNLHEQV